MTEFLQQLLNGISLGAIYALIALGYTMVYGVLRFINFAHSDVFMVGAFIGYYAGQHLPHGTIGGGLAAMAAAMVGCAILGIAIERFVYRPLRSSSTLNVLITAIGMSLFLEYTGQLVFGATPRAYPALFPSTIVSVHGLIISMNQVVVIVVAAILMVALQFAVFRTKIGTAMRAVALNPAAARLVGINIDVVISFTFGLGSALAAAGGVLYAINYPSIDPLMGVVPGLKAFIAAVLGGIGNIPGAALGALILGLVETFVDGSHWSTYKDAIAFAILIGILLFRPAGLLGRFTAEKV
ncbi:MAG TPA: branched-chain amino acid ABC transporter permease [Opitutaceae bacterium]|jgi:branched-chain amino acid transport system permease protein